MINLIFSAITIIVRYYFKRKWQNLPIPKEVQHQVYNNDYTNLMRHNRRKRFVSYKLVFDVIICLIFPFPFREFKFYISEYVPSQKNFLEAEYLVSDMLLIVMFSRIYLVVRNALNHTEFTDPYPKLL